VVVVPVLAPVSVGGTSLTFLVQPTAMAEARAARSRVRAMREADAFMGVPRSTNRFRGLNGLAV